ncbi:hypothetical protein DESA109040_22635 [Deinococcus saxicola]|uniref:replication initiator protein A n=1 Tax=Deinococcus saxicola TaxID=249406 RepID=UPI0039EF3149
MADGATVKRIGADERNLARLSPVLSAQRIDAEMTSWHKSVQVDALGTIEIICRAREGKVVPHGIDGDVMFALTALYVMQGSPAIAFIELSAAELSRLVGLPEGGRTLVRVKESLERLYQVSFEVREAWKIPGKKGYRNRLFGIVSSLEDLNETGDDEDGEKSTALEIRKGQYTPKTRLRIALSPELVESIRAGHIRSIDLNLYAELQHPLARQVYRTLEELRSSVAEGDVYEVSLSAWAGHLGMRELIRDTHGVPQTLHLERGRVMHTRVHTPDKIRRALEPAHADLIANGYLRTAQYVGRGAAQTVRYTFGVPTTPVDLELIGVLTSRGVAREVAESRVRAHGREAVMLAAAAFDARLAGGYVPRNRGGLLIDMLGQPGKYHTPQDSARADVAAPRRRTITGGPGETLDLLPQLDTAAIRKTNTFWLKQWKVKGVVTAEQVKILEACNARGQLDDPSLNTVAATAGPQLTQTLITLIEQFST